jgi:hypothetical protein
MRLLIFMFFFIMYSPIILLFQTWYNNIFKTKPKEIRQILQPLALSSTLLATDGQANE